MFKKFAKSQPGLIPALKLLRVLQLIQKKPSKRPHKKPPKNLEINYLVFSIPQKTNESHYPHNLLG